MFSVFCVSISKFAIVALISRFTVATPGFPLLISALKLPLGTPLFQFAALLQLPVASVHILLVCAELPAARTPHSTAKHNAPPRRIDAIRSFKPSLFMISPQRGTFEHTLHCYAAQIRAMRVPSPNCCYSE